MRKRCSTCSRVKPLSMFYTRPNSKGFSTPISTCKKCDQKRNAEWRRVNYDRFRLILGRRQSSDIGKKIKSRSSLRSQWRNLGLNPDAVEAFVAKHSGACDICGRRSNERKLNVDHCHKQLRIRGLLCFRCNVGLGCFSDSVELLQQALKYLESK